MPWREQGPPPLTDRRAPGPGRKGRLQLQILPEPFGLGTAHWDLRALGVLHPEDVIPAEPGHYLLDLVDVDQMRAMNSPENVRVEPRLQVVQCPVVRAAGHMACHYVNRLVSQGGIDDVIRVDEEEPFAHLDGHLIPPHLAVRRHHFYDSFELVV